MPFDTVNRLSKRVRLDGHMTSLDEDDYYSQYAYDGFYRASTRSNSDSNSFHHNNSEFPHSSLSQGWSKPVLYDPDSYHWLHPTVELTPQLAASSNNPAASSIQTFDIASTVEYFDTSSFDDSILTARLLEDSSSATQSDAEKSPSNTFQNLMTTPCSPVAVTNTLSFDELVKPLMMKEKSMAQLENSLFLTDILSKVRFSYTDVGINLEAKVSNATDLTSLIEAFSQICCSSLANSTVTPNNARNEPTNRIVLSRNKSNQLKPVNFFKSACQLGIIANPHSSLETFSELKQIADACVDTFFLCKVRFKPIIQKDEFIRWYRMQENPLDTLIVNAMCSYVFRHMVIHHPRPAFKHFLQDLDKVQEQEEYFFSCARERLAQSFDTPDRYTVIALLFMSTRAEPSKRHHYAGMAVTAMHQLDIYPRMVHEEPDSYEKEMDTRLWWYLWAVDFSIWTAGSPKNSPQPKHPGEPDLPLVFEEDIDESEINVITFSHCLKLWRIQSNIVSALYDQQNSETMTVEQLYEFDKKLQHFYNQLPSYLVLDSGFEYGCEDLFLSCLRVNIEYNATRIILHKLFIPEMNDTAPNQSSLDSLNICLSTALTQLSAIKTCNMGDVGRCAFDRDELWRAAEVVSVAMDIYHNCLSLEAKQRILTNIKMDDFNRALQKSYEVLKNTREFRFSCKNWFQVADWIQAELQRHQSKYNSSIHDYHLPEEPTKVNKPDFFLAHLKPTATLNSRDYNDSYQQFIPIKNEIPAGRSNKPAVTKSANNKPRQKSITFQNHFSMHSSSFASSVKQQPTTSNNDTRRMSSSSTQLMEYNPDVLPSHTQQQKQFSNKTSARFRYFNPRKMNKFLFIDEHPML